MSSLVIPLDLSQVPEEERKQLKVKVAVDDGEKITSAVARVGAKGEVKLEVDGKRPLTVAIGSDSASDEDLFRLQTINVQVSPHQWQDKPTLTLPPIVITPHWWRLWLLWCRDFVITGRVVCADGSPVPGAEVRAYDVDFFWWWSSTQQVGPAAVTDAAGHFTIKFRWCCGWWPWWWWRQRRWRLDNDLFDKIRPVVELNPRLKLPDPDPEPNLDFLALTPQPELPRRLEERELLPRFEERERLAATVPTGRKLDPTVIPAVREQFLAQLPQLPEFERLRIWPWWPWNPWLDCGPDIIFRVTQNCGGQVKVIRSESVFQTRWDIPPALNVTLLANSQACCLANTPPDPVGDCVVITGVCGDPGIPVTSIGGNSGAPATPVGYANPGGRDRPFAEQVTISGQFGTAAQADYYEIEYSPHAMNTWLPVPPASMLDFARGYFDATQPWPNQWFYPGFPVLTLGGRHVYKSRRRYETENPPANWGQAMTGRSWFYNVNLLAVLQTAGNFSDGTYDFRIVGYRALANGDLDPATRQVMPGCGNNAANNLLTLRVDNRVVGPSIPGSVHINTTEPDCGITSVTLGSASVPPCGSNQLAAGTPLDIEFFVTDPHGHLDHYELVVKYDLGSTKNLLSVADVGAFTLTGGPGVQTGPDYLTALAQAGSPGRPTWNGGSMHLHIANASLVFPKTCCYLVQLTVWKRNIVSCGSPVYYNQMHYSFTVIV